WNAARPASPRAIRSQEAQGTAKQSKVEHSRAQQSTAEQSKTRFRGPPFCALRAAPAPASPHGGPAAPGPGDLRRAARSATPAIGLAQRIPSPSRPPGGLAHRGARQGFLRLRRASSGFETGTWPGRPSPALELTRPLCASDFDFSDWVCYCPSRRDIAQAMPLLLLVPAGPSNASHTRLQAQLAGWAGRCCPMASFGLQVSPSSVRCGDAPS
ncbi:hypothetical protein BDY21DRAFT_397986, partial [Lineolata rhizophorae]